MKNRLFLALAAASCLFLPSISHGNEINDERFVFVNGGTAYGVPPCPIASISYTRLLGNHAVDTTFSLETAFVLTLLGGSIDYQYYFTPELMKSWFVGVGVQAYVYNDIFAGPKLSFGTLQGAGSRRCTISLSVLTINGKTFIEPKLEYGFRINAPK